MMRALTAAGLVIVCCASLAACTAGTPAGPNVAVTSPAVGRPQPPSSVDAALSSQAFTPYAALGQSDDDGLASGQSYFALAEACMADSGYPDPSDDAIPISISLSPANLAFGQAWGQWGYLGTALAQQDGFNVPPGTSARTLLGISVPAANLGSVSQAEQAAVSRCFTIIHGFTDSMQSGALAVITTLSNDIYRDVRQHPAVMKATRSWSACMGKNGYSFGQPYDAFFSELKQMRQTQQSSGQPAPITPSVDHAQLATATSDADCTQSTDLAGIYFAVQASYERQLVSTNQQALTKAVRQYRTAYASELRKLPALLRTASSKPAKPAKSAGSPGPTSG